MNLLKKFIGTDTTDIDDEADDLYMMPEDLKMEIPEEDPEASISALDSPARKDPEIRPVTSADKVSLKLLQPKSHIEAAKIADKLKEGCIVLLDISNLTKDQTHRLIDFLAGVAYVLGGEMIRTNKSTIVVSPAGVDISGFAQDAPEEEPAEEEEVVVIDEEEIDEEEPVIEEA